MKKEYKKPISEIIDIHTDNILAVSNGLKYTEEEADSDYGVLTKKQQGEWGNIWK